MKFSEIIDKNTSLNEGEIVTLLQRRTCTVYFISGGGNRGHLRVYHLRNTSGRVCKVYFISWGGAHGIDKQIDVYICIGTCVCVCVCVCARVCAHSTLWCPFLSRWRIPDTPSPLSQLLRVTTFPFDRREVCGCDGWMCDLETIGTPSILRVIHNTAVLTRMMPTFDLSCEENVTRR